ncbi:MAG: relaxase/mobilization nuclease domain-containing protein [Leptolyngbyaceae cyanobacterium CSU_1_3]|nr:relaxase/mobilization nuclease domain-containing protein [Leptolyngbyaceae cyanobacterium CSU_1_3]
MFNPFNNLMIGKHFKGKAFYPILNYALSKPGAQLLETNLATFTPANLAQELNCLRRLNPRVERCMYHASLSLPLGERLEDQSWPGAAQAFLWQMGFDDNPYVVLRHCDRPQNHIHIITSRIHFDGSCVSDRWDHYRLQAVTRQLEQLFELTPVPARWEKQPDSVLQNQEESIHRLPKKQIQL